MINCDIGSVLIFTLQCLVKAKVPCFTGGFSALFSIQYFWRRISIVCYLPPDFVKFLWNYWLISKETVFLKLFQHSFQEIFLPNIKIYTTFFCLLVQYSVRFFFRYFPKGSSLPAKAGVAYCKLAYKAPFTNHTKKACFKCKPNCDRKYLTVKFLFLGKLSVCSDCYLLWHIKANRHRKNRPCKRAFKFPCTQSAFTQETAVSFRFVSFRFVLFRFVSQSTIRPRRICSTSTFGGSCREFQFISLRRYSVVKVRRLR